MRTANALLLAALTTVAAGCNTLSRLDYGPSSDVQVPAQVKSDFHLDSQKTVLGVPFLCFHVHEGGPYRFNLYLRDDQNQLQAIAVDEVVVEYPHGKIDKRTVDFKAQRDGVYGPVLNKYVDDLVTGHSKVTIRVRGQLTKLNGEVQPFETSQSFEPESEIRPVGFRELLPNC